MSRMELEAAASALLAAVVAFLVTPPVAPELETAGDRRGQAGTGKRQGDTA